MERPDLTPEQSEMIEQSQKAVRDIDELLENESFRRFMERFQRRADELADEILHSELPKGERKAKRFIRLGILEVLAAPVMDCEGHARILAGFGIGVD
jgi:hypothetical protein